MLLSTPERPYFLKVFYNYPYLFQMFSTGLATGDPACEAGMNENFVKCKMLT